MRGQPRPETTYEPGTSGKYPQGAIFVNDEESNRPHSDKEHDDAEVKFRQRYRIRWKPARYRAIGLYIMLASIQGLSIMPVLDHDPLFPHSQFILYILSLSCIMFTGFIPFFVGYLGSRDLLYATLNEVHYLSLRVVSQGVAELAPIEFRRLYSRLGSGNCALKHDLIVIGVTIVSLFMFSQLPPVILAVGSHDLRTLGGAFIFIPAFDLGITLSAFFPKRRWLKASDNEIANWLRKEGREIKRKGERPPWPPPPIPQV